MDGQVHAITHVKHRIRIFLILFLDYDGVLHPDAAFHNARGVELRAPGELFMHAANLNALLAEYTHVKIILSTSRVRQLDFRRAKNRLPEALPARVIGGTFRSALDRGPVQMPWMERPRFNQIASYLARHKV